MNQQQTLIKFGTWKESELRAYYVGERGGRSAYAQGKNFTPGILGEVAPKQINQTERNDGAFIHAWAGGPDLRRDVEAILEVGFKHATMAGAVHYLRQYHPDEADVIEKMAWKARHVTRVQVAATMGIPLSTFDRMVKRAIEAISDYLDAWLNGMADSAS